MIILLRHARTDWNAKDGDTDEILRGSEDPPLNAEGRAEALAAARKICRYPVKEVRRGTFLRDKQTAQIVAAECRVAEVEDKRLNPYDIGAASGRPLAEMWPLLSLLLEIPYLPAPGGESYDAYRTEWAQVFWEAYGQYGGRDDAGVVLVTHGTEFRTMPWLLFGEPPATDKRERIKTAETMVIN